MVNGCGEKIYEIITESDFLTLEQLPENKYQLSVHTISEDDVGSHVVTMQVSMADYGPYGYVEPLNVSFSVVIESAINEPPYFEKPLADYFPL